MRYLGNVQGSENSYYISQTKILLKGFNGVTVDNKYFEHFNLRDFYVIKDFLYTCDYTGYLKVWDLVTGVLFSELRIGSKILSLKNSN